VSRKSGSFALLATLQLTGPLKDREVVFIAEAEPRRPQGIKLWSHLLNDPSPLRGQVKRWCMHDRQCSGCRLTNTLPVIQNNCPNMELARKDDRLAFAVLKAGRVLERVHLQAVLNIYNGDPVTDGLFDLTRSGLAFAIDDDFPVDGCGDCNRAQNGMEQRQVLQR
jgi:hypothetical protein